MEKTATPKDLLKKYGIRPRKRLGQSFLIDGNVMAKIVRVAGIRREDTVVEIGAGLGVMTALMAKAAHRVIALELDKGLIAVLREELKGLPHVDIVETDVLRYDFLSAPEDATVPKLNVIGNIPYHISTPILFHLLAFRQHIGSMVLMLQKEVAERIAAPPATKAYGTVSVILSMFFDISREFIVSSKCFFPPPKVDSAVLKMTVRDQPRVSLQSQDFFQKLVRAAFGQRRKTLINNLKDSPLLQLEEARLVEALVDLGIDGKRRGETLSVEEFGRLSNVLFSMKQFA